MCQDNSQALDPNQLVMIQTSRLSNFAESFSPQNCIPTTPSITQLWHMHVLSGYFPDKPVMPSRSLVSSGTVTFAPWSAPSPHQAYTGKPSSVHHRLPPIRHLYGLWRGTRYTHRNGGMHPIIYLQAFCRPKKIVWQVTLGCVGSHPASMFLHLRLNSRQLTHPLSAPLRLRLP
jgi:hypothetical protein